MEVCVEQGSLSLLLRTDGFVAIHPIVAQYRCCPQLLYPILPDEFYMLSGFKKNMKEQKRSSLKFMSHANLCATKVARPMASAVI